MSLILIYFLMFPQHDTGIPFSVSPCVFIADVFMQ